MEADLISVEEARQYPQVEPRLCLNRSAGIHPGVVALGAPPPADSRGARRPVSFAEWLVLKEDMECGGSGLHNLNAAWWTPQIVEDAVKDAGLVLEFASEDIRDNAQIVLGAVQADGCALKFASERVRSTASIVLPAVNSNGSALTFASEHLKNDRDIVLAACRKGYGERMYEALTSGVFGDFDENTISDDEWKSIWQRHLPLAQASPAFRDDKEVVLAALKPQCWTGGTFSLASNELQRDPDIILAATKDDVSLALARLPDHLCDKPFALRLVDCNVEALKFLPSMQGEYEVVIRAVTLDGNMIRYASDDMRQDRTIAMTAVKNQKYNKSHTSVLKYLAMSLQADKDIVLEAIRQAHITCEYSYLSESNPQMVASILTHASAQFRGDLEVMMEAIKHSRSLVQIAFPQNKYTDPVFQLASPVLRADRAFVSAAMQLHGVHGLSDTFSYASDELRGDPEFVLHLIDITDTPAVVLQYASATIRQDRDVLLRAVHKCGTITCHAASVAAVLQLAAPVLQDDGEIVTAAINSHPQSLGYASDALRHDRSLVMSAVSKDGNSICFASRNLRRDPKVVAAAIIDGNITTRTFIDNSICANHGVCEKQDFLWEMVSQLRDKITELTRECKVTKIELIKQGKRNYMDKEFGTSAKRARP